MIHSDPPLIAAVRSKNVERVRRLLEKGADVHAEDDRALYMASNWGDVSLIRLLLDHGANALVRSETSFMVAAGGWHLEAVRLFLDLKNPPTNLKLGCFFALSRGRLDVVKLLIERGLDVQMGNNYLLRMAIHKGATEIARYFLDQGADIHVDRDLPLRLALDNGEMGMIQLLVERGANVKKGIRHAQENNYEVPLAWLEKVQHARQEKKSLSAVKVPAKNAPPSRKRI